MRRRGFALAMALIVILILGIMVGVILDRHNAQMLTVKRQLDAYAMHHVTAGLGESIDAWKNSNGSKPLREVLGPQGHAFDLTLEGGQNVRVSLYEAQGLALADLAGLPSEQLTMGRDILIRLRQTLGADAGRYTRMEGPLAVSLRTAPREVLLAAAESALRGAGDAESLVDALMAARVEAGDEPMDLNRVLADAEVDADARARVALVVATDTVLWRGVAELEIPAGTWPPRDPVVYQFWANIRPTRGNQSNASLLQRQSVILRWERVNPS